MPSEYCFANPADYDQEVGEEDGRLDDYPFEFAVTMRFIAQHLSPGARILDAACGTGRYAEALVAGYLVGASDLSDAAVEHTRQRLGCGDLGARLLFTRRAKALHAVPQYQPRRAPAPSISS